MLENKAVLITGGTGSFGQCFASTILEQFPDLKRLVIFSRDELKQYEMSCKPEFSGDNVRFFLGDIRDQDRIRRALEGVDVVVHAAALKQVPAAEYNPFEAIKTNVLGAQNLIEGCLEQNVEKVIALSTDKAAAPVNLYGATKLCADKLFIAANGIVGARNLKFSVVRYGNVFGSRGSVAPFFEQQKSTGILPITHPEMTRFSISLNDGCRMVLWALKHMQGGEIFVPKIPSYRILDVAKAICDACEHPITGIRPGEKLHEEMITESDSYHTVDLGDYFAILPFASREHITKYLSAISGKPMKAGTAYSSKNNNHFLTIEEIKKLVDASRTN